MGNTYETRLEEIRAGVKKNLERDITLTLKAGQVVALRRLIYRLLEEKREQAGQDSVDQDFYDTLDTVLWKSLHTEQKGE